MKKNCSLAKNVFLLFSFVFLFFSCTNIENVNEIKTDDLSNTLKITLQANVRYISAYDFKLSNFEDWTLTFKDENNKNTTLSLSVSYDSTKTQVPSLSYSNGVFIAKNIPTGTYTITIEGTYTQNETTYTITGSKTGIEIVQGTTTKTSLFLGLKKSSSGYGGLNLSLNNANDSNYFSNISSAEARLTSRSGGTNYSTKDENSVLFFEDSYRLSADNGNIASGWYSLSFTLDGYNFILSDTEIEIADGLTTSDSIYVTTISSKTYYATNNDAAIGNGNSTSSRANLTTLLEKLSESLPREQLINIYVNDEPEIDLYALSKLKSKLADNKNEYRKVIIYNESGSEVMQIAVTQETDKETYTASVERISNSITLIGRTVGETAYKTVDVGQINTTQETFTITLVDGVAINLTSTDSNEYLTNTLRINAVTSDGTENLSAYYDMPFITFRTNPVANKMFDITIGYEISYTKNEDGTFDYFITSVTMETGTEINETLTSLISSYEGDSLLFKAYTGSSNNIETSNKLSSDDSKTPCYVWLDSNNSTVYYYAEGYTDSDGTHLILLNEESADMFKANDKFTEIDMSGFSTQNVTNMSYMFSGCSSLKSIDVSHFDTSNVTNMSYMFSGCSALTTIYAASDADWSDVALSDNMFEGCIALESGNETKYDPNNVDATYARINKTENLGYFTEKNF